MKRALILGFNYRGTDYELGGCENDARAINSRIRATVGSYYLNQFEVELNDLSGDQLFGELARYREISKPSDTFYFTMSGHGTQVPQPDGTFKEGICLFYNGKIEVVYDSDLWKALEQIPGTVVCILDTCYSGGMYRGPVTSEYKRKFIWFDSGKMDIYEPAEERDMATPVENRLYYIAACGKDEVAWDTGSAGLFTQAFCNGYDKVVTRVRTVAFLTKFAYKQCAPDQHPNYAVFHGNGAKRLF